MFGDGAVLDFLYGPIDHEVRHQKPFARNDGAVSHSLTASLGSYLTSSGVRLIFLVLMIAWTSFQVLLAHSLCLDCAPPL